MAGGGEPGRPRSTEPVVYDWSVSRRWRGEAGERDSGEGLGGHPKSLAFPEDLLGKPLTRVVTLSALHSRKISQQQREWIEETGLGATEIAQPQDDAS